MTLPRLVATVSSTTTEGMIRSTESPKEVGKYQSGMAEASSSSHPRGTETEPRPMESYVADLFVNWQWIIFATL
jgi:hypothetical protein